MEDKCIEKITCFSSRFVRRFIDKMIIATERGHIKSEIFQRFTFFKLVVSSRDVKCVRVCVEGVKMMFPCSIKRIFHDENVKWHGENHDLMIDLKIRLFLSLQRRSANASMSKINVTHIHIHRHPYQPIWSYFGLQAFNT